MADTVVDENGLIGELSAPVRLRADVVMKQMGSASVIVHLRTSRIYELNVTGTRIVELLNGEQDAGSVVVKLCQEFEVAPDEARKAVGGLIALLAREDLLDTRHA